MYNEVNRINLLFVFFQVNLNEKQKFTKCHTTKKHLFLFKSSELFAQSFFFHTTNVPLTKRVDFKLKQKLQNKNLLRTPFALHRETEENKKHANAKVPLSVIVFPFHSVVLLCEHLKRTIECFFTCGRKRQRESNSQIFK